MGFVTAFAPCATSLFCLLSAPLTTEPTRSSWCPGNLKTFSAVFAVHSICASSTVYQEGWLESRGGLRSEKFIALLEGPASLPLTNRAALGGLSIPYLCGGSWHCRRCNLYVYDVIDVAVCGASMYPTRVRVRYSNLHALDIIITIHII